MLLLLSAIAFKYLVPGLLGFSALSATLPNRAGVTNDASLADSSSYYFEIGKEKLDDYFLNVDPHDLLEAIRLLEKAISFDKESAVKRLHLGNAYYLNNDFESASSAFSLALSIHNKNKLNLYFSNQLSFDVFLSQYAHSEYRLGHYEFSFNFLDKALEIYPDNEVMRKLYTHAGSKYTEKLKREFHDELSVSKKLELGLELGRTQLALLDVSGADWTIGHLERTNDNSPEVFYLIGLQGMINEKIAGDNHEGLELLIQAVTDLKSAYELGFEYELFYVHFGAALLKVHSNYSASTIAGEGLQLYPENPVLWLLHSEANFRLAHSIDNGSLSNSDLRFRGSDSSAFWELSRSSMEHAYQLGPEIFSIRTAYKLRN